MKRVVVIGSPGAGKTTFVRKLSLATGLPAIHLDYYYHQKPHDYPNKPEAWLKKINQLLKRDSWIMDGNYSSSFGQRFNRADTIIFLDYPTKTSLYGVIMRRIKYHNKKRVDMPDDWKESANVNFLKYVWGFNKTDRDIILDTLATAKDKQIAIFTDREQTDRYLASLSKASSQPPKR